MPYYAAKVWLKSQDACKLTDELRQKISECLRQECTVIDSAGKEQSEIALLRSWQRYLITSILLFCRIRLQTLCRLELAHNLLRAPYLGNKQRSSSLLRKVEIRLNSCK